MIIAIRSLSVKSENASYSVQVRIFAPEQEDNAWICRYEIGWPESTRKNSAAGLDSVQALHLVLQKIGIDIYMSGHHESGTLMWINPDDGYGFPVPKNGRDFLIDSDRIFEG